MTKVAIFARNRNGIALPGAPAAFDTSKKCSKKIIATKHKRTKHIYIFYWADRCQIQHCCELYKLCSAELHCCWLTKQKMFFVKMQHAMFAKRLSN